jgi:hypothetical protein
VNSKGIYDLSEFFVDDDGNNKTMTANSSFSGGAALPLPAGILTLPNWSTVAIAPTQMSELGIYLITVTLSDSLATVSSNFNISVINTPPYFLSTVPADFTMRFNNTYVFYVPKFKDDEGHAVTVVLDSVPSGLVDFAIIIDNDHIEFTPSKWSDFKDYDLQITLTDGNMQSEPY